MPQLVRQDKYSYNRYIMVLAVMPKKIFLTEDELAAKAKEVREATGKRKALVARELGVSFPSIFNAEEKPELPLHKLRVRMIQTYSKYKVVGPVYYLECK